FSSRRRHTRFSRDWSSDVCSSDLETTSRKQTSKNRSWLRYAAAAVLVISGGLFFLIKEKGNGGYEPVQAVILPGGNKATLARDRSEERREGKSADVGGGRSRRGDA